MHDILVHLGYDGLYVPYTNFHLYVTLIQKLLARNLTNIVANKLTEFILSN